MHLEPTEAWWLLGVCVTLVVIFLLVAHFTKLKTKIPRFYSWIGAIAVFGGVLAFLLPIALNSGFGKDDDGRILRQLILYTTGGVLGVITLGETHRKNSQEKEKNENDHTRQVHTERRSRYTTAVEQLANEKAAVRLGGIYTLVGLVDEWLADDSLESEEQQKEGQVIINNLCAYIRSPFPHIDYRQLFEEKEAENQIPEEHKDSFLAKRAQFREEQDVRGAIMREIVARLGVRSFDDIEEETTVEEGPWSDFTYDFSRAPFPYKIDFDDSIINSQLLFSGAVFSKTASFNNSIFKKYVSFEETIFEKYIPSIEFLGIKSTSFNFTIFEAHVSFEKSIFKGSTSYGSTNFKSSTSFQGATFIGTASFISANFKKLTSFTETNFKNRTLFLDTKFEDSTFFFDATFEGPTSFDRVTFEDSPGFNRMTFGGETHFINCIFKNPVFSNIVFSAPVRITKKPLYNDNTSSISFSDQIFFSSKVPPEDYEFEASTSNPQVETEHITVADGRVFTIPVGCELFDPEPLPALKPEEKPTE